MDPVLGTGATPTAAATPTAGATPPEGATPPVGATPSRSPADGDQAAAHPAAAHRAGGDQAAHPPAGRPVPSFWLESVGGRGPSRPRLDGPVEADVCIVGAGYTVLWTAWALLRQAPDVRVVVVEAQYAGFGASGRNGGWLSGLLPGSRERLAAGEGGRSGVMALQRALIDAVSEVGAIAAAEGVDCDFHHGGTLAVAVNRAQLDRLLAGVAEDRAWGVTDDDMEVLAPAAVTDRVRVGRAVGGTFSPHCARIHPAKLVLGLAGAVERRGGTIYEHSPALEVADGRVRTGAGSVDAPWVVVATEGYTASLPGRRRRLLPMNSHMIITSPLPAEVWAAIGWDGAETVMDGGHSYVYLQRTADGRVAAGGRGVPYRYGSGSARDALDGSAPAPPAETVRSLEAALPRLFPDAARLAPDGLRAERAWSGVLGVARDWCPSIGVERTGAGAGAGSGAPTDGRSARSDRRLGSGRAWAGGYVGDGVTTSHLAGLTLADLILGVDSPRTRLPWVGRRSRPWEPEPLRWLGVTGVYALYRAADRDEARHPERARTSAWARVADSVAGRH